MLVLGIETSTPALSLALRRDGQTLAARRVHPPGRHAESLLSELDALLTAAGLAPQALDGVAVGLGPGGFTGLRVGVATAQGLAQALAQPVAGIPSFEAAAAAAGSGTTAVIADAHRGELYAAVYRSENGVRRILVPEGLYTPAALAALLPSGPGTLTGPAAEAANGAFPGLAGEWRIITGDAAFPDAAWIAALAEPRLAAGGDAGGVLTPHYLRRTQAEEVRAAGRGQTGSGGGHAAS